MIMAGTSILWKSNPFNLEEEALSKFQFDVFVYWVGWGLCFFAYYLKAESFVVAAAGLVMASFTYRQALTTSEVNGQSFEGTTGNLASVPALVMCGNFYRNDLGHQKNTGATWDPDYAARSSLNGYSYAMEKDDAKMCTAGLSLMFVGQLIALILGAKAGKGERESPNCIIKLLGLAVAFGSVCGCSILFGSDEARLSASTYFMLSDQLILVLLAGILTGLAYFTAQDGLIFAAALLAAFCAITNLSTMFVVTGSTSASVTDLQSGFVLNELAMVGATVAAVLNKEFFGGGKHTKLKVVPFNSNNDV